MKLTTLVFAMFAAALAGCGGGSKNCGTSQSFQAEDIIINRANKWVTLDAPEPYVAGEWRLILPARVDPETGEEIQANALGSRLSLRWLFIAPQGTVVTLCKKEFCREIALP
jgi:hypothetical protein